jgi:hypothetical protein
MKERKGFVSNSSSSSFIIVSNEKEPQMTVTLNLDSLIELTIHNEKELEDYFLTHYDYNNLEAMFLDDTDLKESYETCLKAITEGKYVMFGDCSSDSYDTESSFLYSNGFQGEMNFEVIQGV